MTLATTDRDRRGNHSDSVPESKHLEHYEKAWPKPGFFTFEEPLMSNDSDHSLRNRA